MTVAAPAGIEIEWAPIHELSPALVRTLRGLTRRSRGLMRDAFDRALSCNENHPNREALAIIAREEGQIVGWALVHATAIETREKPYSRRMVYHGIDWHCYLYVRRSRRGRGIGRLLVSEATDHAREQRLGALRVRPWDAQSAKFFARIGRTNARVWWADWERPEKFL
jgi:GNAT superfamily N-acetyltransferase